MCANQNYEHLNIGNQKILTRGEESSARMRETSNLSLTKN